VLLAALLVRQFGARGTAAPPPRFAGARILLHPRGSLPSQGATGKAVKAEVT
jgi:hypothetical protein